METNCFHGFSAGLIIPEEQQQAPDGRTSPLEKAGNDHWLFRAAPARSDVPKAGEPEPQEEGDD